MRREWVHTLCARAYYSRHSHVSEANVGSAERDGRPLVSIGSAQVCLVFTPLNLKPIYPLLTANH